eukprot:gene1662-2488_t
MVCDGKNSCNIGGLSCEQDMLCVDFPRDDCDPLIGDANCRGCCVADDCLTTRCQPNHVCALDAFGRGLCEKAPDACCDAVATCPVGTHAVKDCTDASLKDGTCTYRSVCCDRVACQLDDVQSGVCDKAKACGGIAGIQCSSAAEVCIDNPDDNCDPKTGGADCG